MQGLTAKFNRHVLHDNNEINYIALVNRQPHAYIDVDTHQNVQFQPTGSTVPVQLNMEHIEKE